MNNDMNTEAKGLSRAIITTGDVFNKINSLGNSLNDKVKEIFEKFDITRTSIESKNQGLSNKLDSLSDLVDTKTKALHSAIDHVGDRVETRFDEAFGASSTSQDENSII